MGDWLKIDGYPYAINSLGEVKSLPRLTKAKGIRPIAERILEVDGCGCVVLYDGLGGRRKIGVNRLMRQYVSTFDYPISRRKEQIHQLDSGRV